MRREKRTWRDELVNVGKKHVGKSIFWVYTHDQDYLNVLRDEFEVAAARKAIEHRDRVDPFYHDAYLAKGFRE